MPVPPEVESLIADAPVSAHVATANDGRPHVAPVWYGYRDGVLYFMTGGRKLANIRRNPRVAISIEDARGSDVNWNVTLLGSAAVSDDPERMEWASGWIYDAYEDEDADSGGTSDEAAAAGEDGAEGGEHQTGDEGSADEYEYALVEVEFGSASWNVYE